MGQAGGTIVTIAEPVKVPEQFGVLNPVSPYVLVTVGLTGMYKGVEVTPLIVTGVLLSVYVMFQGGLPMKSTIRYAV